MDCFTRLYRLFRWDNSHYFGHIAVNDQTLTSDTYLVDGNLYDRTNIFQGKNKAGSLIKKEQINAPIRTFMSTPEYQIDKL
jgi:hypothetical protein